MTARGPRSEIDFNPKLESPLTSREMDQSLISQSLKVTSKGLESGSNEKPNMPAVF